MSLSLTLTNARQWSPGTPTTRVLTSGRLTIGRSAANDWVLPDPERAISKHHCVIEETNGTFRLIDSSTNGVFINESDQPVGASNAYILCHGDHIRIGDYEIDVAIQPHGGRAPAPQDSAFDAPLTSALDLFGKAPLSPPILEDDSLFALPGNEGRKPPLADLDGGSPLDEAFAPPHVKVPPPIPATRDSPPAEPPEGPGKFRPQTIPTEWDPFAPDSSQGEPAAVERVHPAAPPPKEPPLSKDKLSVSAPDLEPVATTSSPPAAPVRSQPEPAIGDQDRLLRAFFAGAGVDPATAAKRVADSEQMMRESGEIFRIVVAGVIAVLQARRALKREVGAAATEFQPAENNPLKFTLGVDDTVRILLTGGERGYLPPKQAFEEAFDDIKEHQVAVLAGMQEAWMNLLRRLDPKALERRLDGDAGFGKLLILRKARCWDAFLQLYQTIANDAEADYKNLFSRVFSYAYEKHLSAGAKKLR